MRRLWIKARCFLLGHDWTGWNEHLGRFAIRERFRMCRRCDRVQVENDVIPIAGRKRRAG